MATVGSLINFKTTGKDYMTATQVSIRVKCSGVRQEWANIPVSRIEGALALHPSIAFFDGSDQPVLSETHYSITHLKTGCAVQTMVEGRDRAERFLDAIKLLDWDFDKKDGCSRVSNQVLELRRTILEAS